MVTFIEADEGHYRKLAKEDRRHVMVHREADGSLTCEIDGQAFHADNGWQLDSRFIDAGVFRVSCWLDSVFSEPGVMLPKSERVYG